LKAIEMVWDIIVPVLLILGVGGFVAIVRLQTRRLTRTTSRTAEDLYPGYADSPRQQQKYAREHGGQWRDDEGRQDALTRQLAPPPDSSDRPSRSDLP
jgi:hypothetical protein